MLLCPHTFGTPRMVNHLYCEELTSLNATKEWLKHIIIKYVICRVTSIVAIIVKRCDGYAEDMPCLCKKAISPSGRE